MGAISTRERSSTLCPNVRAWAAGTGRDAARRHPGLRGNVEEGDIPCLSHGKAPALLPLNCCGSIAASPETGLLWPVRSTRSALPATVVGNESVLCVSLSACAIDCLHHHWLECAITCPAYASCWHCCAGHKGFVPLPGAVTAGGRNNNGL